LIEIYLEDIREAVGGQEDLGSVCVCACKLGLGCNVEQVLDVRGWEEFVMRVVGFR